MSEWLGKIGDHFEANVFVKYYVYRKSWGKVPKLFLFQDEQSNIIVINSSSKFIIGSRWKIDGIIKKHTIFKGQKQTVITNWGIMFQ